MTKKTPAAAGAAPAALPAGYAGIHGGIVELLDAARQAAARSVNALMTASYWEIGRRIVEAEQQGKRRAGYGEQLIERLSADLTAQFGRGFSRPNLQQMRSFFLTWPIRQTVSSESSPAPSQGRSLLAQGRPGRLDELAQVKARAQEHRQIGGDEGSSRTLSIYLKPTAKVMHCEQCGARCRQVHETTIRRVRDLPLFEYRVVLHVPRRRLWCEQCGGARLERLAWLGRYQRVTDRLAQACSQLLQSSNVQAVARFFDLGWHTVKTLDKARLRESVCEPDWTRIEYLAVDEFALHKGHRYATVLVDPIGRQVLWIGSGRSRETAQAFFEQLPPGVAQRIKAVAIDMTTAYELEIRDHCPQAEIVYDLFHVVAKYGREVIDRVRVDQANRLRQDRPARRIIKSSRWLLLRNRDNQDRQQAVRLDELLQANQPLLTVYVLRDELKRLWFYPRPAWAKQAWNHWCDLADRAAECRHQGGPRS